METSYLTFIEMQLTGCHVMRDLGVENLETDYKQFYICVYVCVCMYLYVWLYVYVCVNIYRYPVYI